MTGDIIVAAVIIVMVAGAIGALVYNKIKGKSSCGCGCTACKQAAAPNVTVEEETCDCCKKD